MRRAFATSTGLLLGYFVLLTALFPHNSLWYDETTSAYLATHSWKTIWEWSSKLDIHPPFYAAMLKLWAIPVGSSEFSLRVFSLFMGWIALAGMIQLGYRVTQHWISGWIASLFLLFSGGFLYAVVEVRGYALAIALAIWSLIFFLRGFTSRRASLIGGTLALAAIYTHYAGVFLLVAQGLYILIRKPRHLFLAMMVPIFGFLPWGLMILHHGGLPAGLAYAGSVPIRAALQTYWDFFIYGQVITDQPAQNFGMIIVLLLGIYAAARFKKLSLLAVCLAAAPLGGFALSFLMGESKLSGRHGWIMWIGIALLVGAGVRKSSLPALVLLTALGIAAFTIRSNLPDQYPSDWRGAFQYIEDHAEDGDILFLRDGTLFTAADYYQISLPVVKLPDRPLTDVYHKLNFVEAIQTIEHFPVSQAPHIWILSWQGDIMEPQMMSYALAEYAGGVPIETHIWGDVYMARYQVKRDMMTLPQHIVELPGLLQVQPYGPSLLGTDVYYESLGAGCPVIIHAWWWRGQTDDPNARVSYRLLGENNTKYDQYDAELSGMTYPQREWIPYMPTLGRAVLKIPPDVSQADVTMTVYDLAGVKLDQTLILENLTFNDVPCPVQAEMIDH